MAFINREKPAVERGAEVPAPVEGFSNRYVNFLTGRCKATLHQDGIYRNPSGARYCSCDMCGQVSVANFGGEFCLFHLAHHDGAEANFFTERLHHYRKVVVLAKTVCKMRSEEGSMLARQLFDAECIEAGIALDREGSGDPISIVTRHIEHEWAAELERRASIKSRKSKPSQEEIVRQQLANLVSGLRSSPSITPTFEGA